MIEKQNMTQETEKKKRYETTTVSLVPQGGLYDSWKDFACTQQKILSKIVMNMGAISELTEEKTIELSHQFQSLSNSAQEQTNRIIELSHLAKSIVVGGQEIEVSEITRLLSETFVNSITSILEMSKQAMVMIYSLDDSIKTLNQIEKSIREIEKINHKTKYLSLNATIEAVRAGEAGESFQVVASEVRDLSNDTQTLATNIRDQVSHLGKTVCEAQNILQSIARIDLTSNLMAKDQLDDMIKGLIDNSHHMSDIMVTAMVKSQEFSKQAGQLISSIQFQDRVKQDFQKMVHEIELLMKASSIISEVSCDTASPEGFQNILDQLHELIDNKGFSKQLIDHQEADDVMLF